MASPGSQAKDRQANKPGASGKTTEGGSGGLSAAAQKSQARAIVDSIANEDQGGLGFGLGSTKALGGKGTGGGTTTQETYTPGAVQNFPDANAAAVADMLSSALPGMGLTNMAYKGAKALADGSDPLSSSAMGPIGDMLGGDPGKQRGFQPDRYRGAASLGGIGGDGGAVNGGDDEREIAGQRFGAGTTALTGDSEDDTGIGAGTDALFSDVALQDRRKPRPQFGAGTQMVLG